MAVLRFVDSIQASPTLRLDLNLSPWSMGPETSFGVPPMRRSVTSSMLRDGDPPGQTSYGNREIELVLNLQPTGGTADAAATQLQLLQRELDRPMNLLQYTPGNVTNTVFFRTFRASPDSIRFDPARKQVRVTVLAEPFALGIREDLAAVTVRNDPNFSNGLFADLTGIKGDVDVPLFIEYTDTGGGLARSGFAVGVRSGSAPYPIRYSQAEQMTQNIDTSVVADPAFSAGSKSRCTFATTPGLGQRLSSNFPNLTNPIGAENWGVFRIFARVAQTVATDVITMAVGPNSFTSNPSVTIKSQTAPQLVDLGTLDSTSGFATTGGFAAAEYRIEIQASMLVDATRVSGTGSLDIDYFAFVPADECFGSWEALGNVPTTAQLGIVDGPNDSVYVATTLTGATPGRSAGGAGITGRLPRVMPGNNRLVIMQSAPTAGSPDALTTSITMTIRYWPRYLLVRPVGT